MKKFLFYWSVLIVTLPMIGLGIYYGLIAESAESYDYMSICITLSSIGSSIFWLYYGCFTPFYLVGKNKSLAWWWWIFPCLSFTSGLSLLAMNMGNNSNKNKNFKVGIWVAFCPPIFGTVLWHFDKMARKRASKIMAVERTPQQLEWFKQSRAYKESQNFWKTKGGKFVLVCFAFTIPFLAILLAFAITQNQALTMPFIILFIPTAMYFFVWFWTCVGQFKARKQLNGENANLYTICIKCGEENVDITNKKFIRTYFDQKTIKQPASHAFNPDHKKFGGISNGSYSPPAEIISTDIVKEYDKSKNQVVTMAIYQVKWTHHEYEITRKCPRCGYDWKTIEDLPEPPTSQINNVHIEKVDKIEHTTHNTIMAPKPLPHVYCVSCGGKNKGENTKCEHCGAPLLKPEPEKAYVFCANCGHKNEDTKTTCDNCGKRLLKHK